jgi:hypothetical protein
VFQGGASEEEEEEEKNWLDSVPISCEPERGRMTTPPWGGDFVQAERRHIRAEQGQMHQLLARRPGDGPVQDQLWGPAAGTDSIHDHRQEHKPLHGIHRDLGGAGRATHEWDLADAQLQADKTAVAQVPELGQQGRGVHHDRPPREIW